MSIVKQLAKCFAVAVLAVLAVPSPGRTQGAAGTQPAAAERDGQHDFDFLIGTWKAHLKRLEKPLTGSSTWPSRWTAAPPGRSTGSPTRPA